jgi:hypothetical protein
MAIQSTQIQIQGLPATQVYQAIGQNAITTVMVCNTTTSIPVLINMYLVSDGQGYAVGPQTQILSKVSVPPTETFILDTEKFILEDNDRMYVEADNADAITVTVSSVSTA